RGGALGVGRRRIALAHHPLHLAADGDRLVELGDDELEHELGALVERLARLDEGAALADVARVVGEEGVELLVLDLQLDGMARRLAAFPLLAVLGVHNCPESTPGAARGSNRQAVAISSAMPRRRATVWTLIMTLL